jgi:dTDP-4-dehydrorhamnose reductase
MDSSKIFIIGAGGQLGTALKKHYSDAGSADMSELDITNTESVNSFDWSRYDTVLNAAAYTNVDGAETPEGRKAAWNVNATAVANLVSVAEKNNLTFVHISTDYVFDGTKDLHTEDEPLSPLSVYGSSKAAGDTVVSTLPKHYMLRTSWVIGEGKNFVRTMLGLAERNISPTVVADQIGRLTFTSELVRAIDHLLTTKAPYGTYNVSNDGTPASWADITREIFTCAGRSDLTVTNISTKDYYVDKTDIAPRPLLSTLDLSKIRNTGFLPKDWKEELKNYIEKELSL